MSFFLLRFVKLFCESFAGVNRSYAKVADGFFRNPRFQVAFIFSFLLLLLAPESASLWLLFVTVVRATLGVGVSLKTLFIIKK